MAGTHDAIGTWDVSGRPLLLAAAGAKSREEPRPRAASRREHGKHERNKPFGRTRDESERPARLARRDAKSELAQVCAHHCFNVATGPTRVNTPRIHLAHLGLILPHESVPGTSRHFAAMQRLVRCWSKSRHREALARNGSVVNDPQATIGARRDSLTFGTP
jgi:hypothetical protein